MSERHYDYLDPLRDFCTGETQKVHLDPARLLRDLHEALHLVQRSMKMMGDDLDTYTEARLECVKDLLERVLNGYATALGNDCPEMTARWQAEIAQARAEFLRRRQGVN